MYLFTTSRLTVPTVEMNLLRVQRPGIKGRKFFSEYVGGIALDLPDDFNNTNSRVNVNQQMNVIRHHSHINDFVSVVVLFFKNEFFKAKVDTVGQNLTAILGAKDNVVLATVNYGMVLLVGFARLLYIHIS